MPPQNNQNQPSPFEITTSGKSKKRGSRGIIVAALIVVFLILSVVAGVLLVRQRQNIQEKAAVSQCPAIEACPVSGQPNLLKNCHPAETDGSAAESLCNAIGRVATCGAAGTQYCCPTVGGAWTTDMTVCNSLAQAAVTPTPTPVPTPTPTALVVPTVTPTPTGSGSPNSCNGSCGSDTNCQSGYICSGGFCRNPICTSAVNCVCASSTTTPTPTPSSTALLTQSPSATPRSIPVSGIDWPTMAGIGVGALAIILSILIAL